MKQSVHSINVTNYAVHKWNILCCIDMKHIMLSEWNILWHVTRICFCLNWFMTFEQRYITVYLFSLEMKHIALSRNKTDCVIQKWKKVCCQAIKHFMLSGNETYCAVQKWIKLCCQEIKLAEIKHIQLPEIKHIILSKNETYYDIQKWNRLCFLEMKHLTLFRNETYYAVQKWNIVCCPEWNILCCPEMKQIS